MADINSENNFVPGGGDYTYIDSSDMSQGARDELEKKYPYKVNVDGANKGGLAQAEDGPWTDPQARAIQKAINAGRASADPGSEASQGALAQASAGQPPVLPGQQYFASRPILTPDQINEIYALERSRIRNPEQLAADKEERRGALSQAQAAMTKPVEFSPLQAALMGYAQSMGGRFIGVGGAMGDAAAAGYGQQLALAQAAHDNGVEAGKLGLTFLQNEDKNDTARDKDALDNLEKSVSAQQRIQTMRAIGNSAPINVAGLGVIDPNIRDVNGMAKVIAQSPHNADMWQRILDASMKEVQASGQTTDPNKIQAAAWDLALQRYAQWRSLTGMGVGASPNYPGAPVHVNPQGPGVAPPIYAGFPAQQGGALPLTPALAKAFQEEGVNPDSPVGKLVRSHYMQESGAGTNTTTSPKGAVGPMQVMPGTFSEVADKGWDINNEDHNLRAGIRYATKGYLAANGDPRLAAIHYYGGPGAMAKAQMGIPVSGGVDPATGKAYPNTFQYGDQVAARINGSGLPATTTGTVIVPDNTPAVPMPSSTPPKIAMKAADDPNAKPSDLQYVTPEQKKSEDATAGVLGNKLGEQIAKAQDESDAARKQLAPIMQLQQLNDKGLLNTNATADVKRKVGNLLAGFGYQGDITKDAAWLENANKILGDTNAKELMAQQGTKTEGDAKRQADTLPKITDQKQAFEFALNQRRELLERAKQRAEWINKQIKPNNGAGLMNTAGLDVQNGWQDQIQKNIGPMMRIVKDPSTGEDKAIFRQQYIDRLANDPRNKNNPNARQEAAQMWIKKANEEGVNN